MPTRNFVLEGETRRFWDISWDGAAVEITSGKWGTNGRAREAKFPTEKERDAFIAAEIAKAAKKGFLEGQVVAPARDADPRAAGQIASLRAAIEARKVAAWRPTFAKGTSGVGVVRGPMTLAPDEAWPTCGHCGAPLTGLLELDLSALPAPDLRADALLQLFWCEAWEAQGSADVCSVHPGSWLARRRERDGVKRQGPEGGRGEGPFAIVGFEGRDEAPAEAGMLWERFENASQEVVDGLLQSVGATLAEGQDEYEAVTQALGLTPRSETKLGGIPLFVQERTAPFVRQIFQIEQRSPFFVNFGDVGAGHLLLLAGGDVEFTWGSH